MKQKFAFLSFVVSILFGMMACQKDDDSSDEIEDSYSHTSLAYIVADNSLSSYSSEDIDEMVEGYKSIDDTANLHMLIYIDDSSTPRLMKIIKKDTIASLETIKTYDEQSSLDEDVMSSIINEALDMYPADSYGLTLWSHGSGWLPEYEQSEAYTTRSFGIDDDNDLLNQDDGTTMDILDLKTALSACPSFKYILFDACDMQDIEVAYELKDCAEYFIGSPGEIPGYGGFYDEIVPAFFAEDNTAETIAEAYYEPYDESYSYNPNGGTTPGRSTNSGRGYYKGGSSQSSDYQYGIAISVIDASKLEDLASATKSILSSYISDSETVSTSNIYSYDNNYVNFYYDLDGFIQEITDGDANYTSWKEAFDDAVPEFYTTDYTYSSYANDGNGGMVSMDDASGVASFIPNNDDFKDAYLWAYYIAVGENYPQYSYLVELVESYQTFYQEYYQELAWDTDAGWKSIGW